MSAARDAILGRVRSASARIGDRPHPGGHPVAAERSACAAGSDETCRRFSAKLVEAGGEVVCLSDMADVRVWLARFAGEFDRIAYGTAVPDALRLGSPSAPEAAVLAVSMATCAVAETGSVALGAPDGRRVQLLAPVHVVVVRRETVLPTLASALELLRRELPSAFALHSGPSKSADIGQLVVTGVHGPGRIVAALVGVPLRR